MNQTLRTILVTPYRWLLRLWWPILNMIRRDRTVKRVLICANNRLMAEYANEAVQFVKHDRRVSTFMTGPEFRLFDKGWIGELAALLKHKYVSYFSARLRWWDLIVFADYQSAERFHPDTRKVLVNHFLGGGKIINGKEYRFNRRMTYQGRPIFTSIFEASEVAAERAIASNPEVAPLLRIVGDLRSDRMLDLRDSRDKIRKEMGFRETSKVVLIQSTWGPLSIMERCGPEIMEHVVRLLDKGSYQFIVSTHPHHWHGPYAEKNPWGKYLVGLERPGLVVIKPEDDWSRAMIASDLVVTDNTSLSATYCQLQKPLIYIEMPDNSIPEASTVNRLYNISPHFKAPADLEKVIEDGLRDYPFDELHKIALEVNSYPGEAAVRVRRELYRLLELSEPSSPSAKQSD